MSFRKAFIIDMLPESGELINQHDRFVDLLIARYNMMMTHPTSHMIIRGSCESDDLYRIFYQIYDHVIKPDQMKLIQGLYNEIIPINLDQIIENDSLIYKNNDSLIYKNMLQQISPLERNHMIFMERNIINQYQTAGAESTGSESTRSESDDKIMVIAGIGKIVNYVENLRKIINELYQINKKISTKQLAYYHLSISTQHKPFDLMPMFDNIKPYNYIGPLKRLAKYYKESNYYEKLYETNYHLLKNCNDRKNRLNMCDQMIPSMRDHIMLQYVKCINSCFTIVVWKPASSGLNELIQFLENRGEIYYVKTIQFTKNGLKNLLFWMYDQITFNERLQFIESKMTNIKTDDENNEVTFIIFDNTKGYRIAGQNSPFKTEIRNMMVRLISKDNNGDEIDPHDTIHINDYFYQTIDLCNIILNSTTLEMLEYMNCERFSLDENRLSNLKFQTLKKFIYANFSLLEIDRIIICSSELTIGKNTDNGDFTMSAYGFENSDMINMLMINDAKNKSTRVTKRVEKNLMGKNRFYFVNLKMIDESDLSPKLFKFFNISDYHDLILNPKNYFYHMGLKVISIDYLIVEKLIRNTSQDIEDLQIIKSLQPELIEEYMTFDSDNIIPSKEIEKIIKN